VLLPAFLPELKRPSEAPHAQDGVPGGQDLAAFIRSLLSPETDNLYAETHDNVDRLLFTLVLDYTRGNQRDAARILGISRQTMRVKLRALGMQVTHSVESSDDDVRGARISTPPPASQGTRDRDLSR